MKCNFCGSEIGDGDKFCMVCGSAVEAMNAAAKVQEEAEVSVNETVSEVVTNQVEEESVSGAYFSDKVNNPESFSQESAQPQGAYFTEQASASQDEQASAPVNEQVNAPFNEQAEKPQGVYFTEQASAPVNEQVNAPLNEQAEQPQSVYFQAQPQQAEQPQSVYFQVQPQQMQQPQGVYMQGQPIYGQPQPAYYNPAPAVLTPEQASMASSSLAMGILGVCFSLTFIFSFLGIIFGAIGLSKTTTYYKLYGKLPGKAMAGRHLGRAGMITGIVLTSIFVIYITCVILLLIGIGAQPTYRYH